MRLYSFVNGLYLNQLQYGLQTAHCVSRLSLHNNESFNEWAANHETIIILDATNSRGVKRAHTLISFIKNHYHLDIPVAIFNEDIDSLDGATTATACILPESVYDFDKFSAPIKRDEINMMVTSIEEAITTNNTECFSYYKPEYLLFCVIKSYNLASH